MVQETIRFLTIIIALDCVHTMPAHFENGEKCDGSKIWASVHTMPAQFENSRKIDSKNSFQDFDAEEKYLHTKNRPVSIQKRWKMICLRCCFKFIPVRVPFSKSTVFEICRQKMCRFVWTGGLSVTFFTVFKICRHRVNAVLNCSQEFSRKSKKFFRFLVLKTVLMYARWVMYVRASLQILQAGS